MQGTCSCCAQHHHKGGHCSLGYYRQVWRCEECHKWTTCTNIFNCELNEVKVNITCYKYISNNMNQQEMVSKSQELHHNSNRQICTYQPRGTQISKRKCNKCGRSVGPATERQQVVSERIFTRRRVSAITPS